jgi:hypothetical protein
MPNYLPCVKAGFTQTFLERRLEQALTNLWASLGPPTVVGLQLTRPHRAALQHSNSYPVMFSTPLGELQTRAATAVHFMDD